MLFSFRKATLADVPFLAEALWHAEGGPAGQMPYAHLFGLKGKTEALDFLEIVLREETEGSELDPNAYLVAETEDGQPAGACCAWVEGACGQASALVKAQALAYVVGIERWRAANAGLRALAKVALPRTEGAVQLEAFYVAGVCKGHGLAARLALEQIRQHKAMAPGLCCAQIQLTNQNTAARKAYEKAGFGLAQSANSADPALLKILGANGKLLLERAV